METDKALIYRFGEFELDPVEHQVTWHGQAVKLTPKAFDLLKLLVEHPGHLWTKEDIFKQIWPDVAVQDSSLTAAISTIRKEIDERVGKECIKTVHTKGYRFVAEVEIIRQGKAEATSAEGSEGRRHRGTLALVAMAIILIAAVVGWRTWLGSRGMAEIVRLEQQAIKFERSGNDKMALETLDELIRLNPAAVGPRVQAAWIDYYDNENDHSKNYLDALAGQIGVHTVASGTSSDTTHEVFLLQAEALRALLEGADEDAVNKLQVADNMNPKNTAVLYQLAMLQIDDGHYDNANANISKCIQVDPEYGPCWYLKIENLVYQNRYDEALSARREAVNRNIDFPWLDEAAAYASLALGDRETALSDFKKLETAGRRLGSNLHVRNALEGAADVYFYLGQLELAERKIQEEIDASPSDYDKASYMLFLAQVNSLHGKIASAEKELQDALSHSNASDIRLEAAKTFAAVGQVDHGERLLTDLGKEKAPLGKGLSEARQFIAGLRDASTGNSASALARLRDAYSINDSIQIGYYLAKVQLQLGMWNDASETLATIADSRGRVVMEGSPSVLPLALLDLGVCNSRLGKKSEAAQYFKEAAEQWQDADPILKQTVLNVTVREQGRR